MTDLHCCAMVPKNGTMRFRACQRVAKITIGKQAFCGLHDPENQRLRREARTAKFNDHMKAARLRDALVKWNAECAALVETFGLSHKDDAHMYWLQARDLLRRKPA